MSPVKSFCLPCGSKNACGFGSVGVAAVRSTSAEAAGDTGFDGFRAAGFFFTFFGAVLRANVFDAAFVGAIPDFARVDAFDFFAPRCRFPSTRFFATRSSLRYHCHGNWRWRDAGTALTGAIY